MDNKTFMHSSGINILIGAYRQLTATLILLSIQLISNIIMDIKHLCRVQRYKCLSAINSNVDSCRVQG